MPKKHAGSTAQEVALPRALMVLGGVIVVGLILVIILTSLMDFIGWNRPRVTTFEECVNSRGSEVQEVEPPVCWTADGYRFQGRSTATDNAIIPEEFEQSR